MYEHHILTMKYSCYTTDSIKLMSEAAGVADLSNEVAANISEDASLKIRQIVDRANKFMRHANRTTLTCADINKALKWSNSQPVFGYECNPNQRIRYSYSAEARVFRYENDEVDLVKRREEKPMVSSSAYHEATPILDIKNLLLT